MTVRFNSIANEVMNARRVTPNPVYREPHQPVSDDYRIGKACAAAQLLSAGFTLSESRAISASAVAGCAVAGDKDIFAGIMSRAWGCANGTRALPSPHPDGRKSERWIEAEARPVFEGKGFDQARSA